MLAALKAMAKALAAQAMKWIKRVIKVLKYPMKYLSALFTPGSGGGGVGSGKSQEEKQKPGQSPMEEMEAGITEGPSEPEETLDTTEATAPESTSTSAPVDAPVMQEKKSVNQDELAALVGITRSSLTGDSSTAAQATPAFKGLKVDQAAADGLNQATGAINDIAPKPADSTPAITPSSARSANPKI